ncbi:MAG TPA: LLM class flavin-dependent oxidoreductase [Dehalococcoidia bacterium]|nr:LLM class flavin-dependent oxidoreductase [Dehalococcoidia bacterium]
MKIGMQLHPDRGVDAVLEEARQADEQGFDSVWLSDHLFNTRGEHKPDVPLDLLTLATAIGAVTTRTRLAWATLNITLRPPALLAKTLTTLDQITHGRVIATLGSGWNKDEWHAYNLPIIDDHDERAEYAREVVQLFKQMWTHPAPELTSFEGKYVQVHNLPFNPEPYQKPHPPIWFGGESEATLRTVKELCDGWMMLSAGGKPETLRAVLASADWPTRPMTLVKGARIVVRETHDAAIEGAQREYEAMKQTAPQLAPQSFGDFLAREVVGAPDECLERIAEMETWGVNYLRVNFQSEAAQDAVARLILPRLVEPAPLTV